jgi:hypothetical protein
VLIKRSIRLWTAPEATFKCMLKRPDLRDWLNGGAIIMIINHLIYV